MGSAGNRLRVAYQTGQGSLLHGRIEDALATNLASCEGEVNLIFTSPPFPLNRKKQYGNLNGDEYLAWLGDLAPRLVKLLAPSGSLVIELGNAWEQGRPVMSLLPLQALMEVLRAGKLNLCQQFVCHNPARLPSPAQWVTTNRIRVKDSFTHVWWMSPSEQPKADNRHVLVDYSPAMKKLLARQAYNDGHRPSGFVINSTSFLKDNGGAIPPNVLMMDEESPAGEVPEDLLTFANTTSTDAYSVYCRDLGYPTHPARMPAGLPEFFIKLLTEEGDLVLDPFGGSNMTGAVAERLKRRWISVEPEIDYINGSKGRFNDSIIKR
ncbi:MAG TPA: site-specific DNA-methyltransferase [Acidimicrobiales bacterium]|nr:site-specific DNA-methyltransferase [Acidimicrobiales bacterium]